MNNKSLFHSLKNALKGLRHALGNERNLQIELVAFLFNGLLIFGLDLSAKDAALILTVCGLVIGLELINTAIERLADAVDPNWNPKIGLVKDIAAGATLIAALIALVVGSLIYYPYIAKLFS